MLEQERIKQAYIEFVLTRGKQPESVYAFAKQLEISEESFYDEYNSFIQLENDIWKGFVVDTITAIQSEEVYGSYSVREKLLAFYYTLIEMLKKQRSFVLKSYERMEKPMMMKRAPTLVEAKIAFKEFANELLFEGRETREVEQRSVPPLMQKYPDLLWRQALTIIDFWINDFSKSFERTDTLIEKSVNTAMDWLGRSPLDSLFDLGKFLYQNRRS